MMKPVGLFIFDLDGTLVDTLEDITASVNFTLHRLGRKPVTLESVRGFVGDGVETLLARALGGRDEFLQDALGIYSVHHSRNLVNRSRLYPGVRETLEHFRRLPMAVVSNKARHFCEPLLEHLGISRYFRLVIGADDGLPLKPAPDAALRIMGELKVPAELTVVVGDGTTDILSGKAAGAVTCAVTWGFRSEDVLKALGPDHVIRRFSELKDLFAPRTT